jgi:hypothetical protein
MKLVKVVLVAVAFAISGSAMAAVGDFRSTGEELREGQLICPQLAEAAMKRAAASHFDGQPAAREFSRDVANATSAN